MKVYYSKVNTLLTFICLALGSFSPSYGGLFEIFNKNKIYNEYLVLENNEVRTKIVTGIGKTKKEAKKNAGKNALLELSPRYIK